MFSITSAGPLTAWRNQHLKTWECNLCQRVIEDVPESARRPEGARIVRWGPHAVMIDAVVCLACMGDALTAAQEQVLAARAALSRVGTSHGSPLPEAELYARALLAEAEEAGG